MGKQVQFLNTSKKIMQETDFKNHDFRNREKDLIEEKLQFRLKKIYLNKRNKENILKYPWIK